jgi:AraC-like DNA-binding protein
VKQRHDAADWMLRPGGALPVRSIGAEGASHLVDALVRTGLDRDELCRNAAIAIGELCDSTRGIEAERLLKLFAFAETRSGDASIGLHAAESTRFGCLVAHLVGSQHTVRDAVSVARRFQVLLLGAAAIEIHERDEATYVTLETGPLPEQRRHLTEYCIASSCRLLRWLTLHAARPSEIHFRHRCKGDGADYQRVFGCPVHFDTSHDGAALPPAAMAERLVSSNEELAAELEALAQAELARCAPPPFREQVVLALQAGRMEKEGSRRDVIARRLGVSTRTLQRRLEDEGTSFGIVLDDTRRTTALELITELDLSLASIGDTVGYADQYAFNKAFRRWTGRSPSEYRRELLRRCAERDQSA